MIKWNVYQKARGIILTCVTCVHHNPWQFDYFSFWIHYFADYPADHHVTLSCPSSHTIQTLFPTYLQQILHPSWSGGSTAPVSIPFAIWKFLSWLKLQRSFPLKCFTTERLNKLWLYMCHKIYNCVDAYQLFSSNQRRDAQTRGSNDFAGQRHHNELLSASRVHPGSTFALSNLISSMTCLLWRQTHTHTLLGCDAAAACAVTSLIFHSVFATVTVCYFPSSLFHSVVLLGRSLALGSAIFSCSLLCRTLLPFYSSGACVITETGHGWVLWSYLSSILCTILGDCTSYFPKRKETALLEPTPVLSSSISMPPLTHFLP